MDKQKYAVIGVETTGLWYLTDKITKISIVMLEDDQIIDQYESLVNPETEILDYVEEITGISNEMVASAPALKEVFQDALNFISDAPLVAYNASFDQGFWNEGLKSIGQDGVDIICTKELCKRMYPHSIVTASWHWRRNCRYLPPKLAEHYLTL